MDEQKIREFIEEIDPRGEIPADRIEGFIAAVKEGIEHPLKDGEERGGLVFHRGNLEESLKEQLANTTDWKKRAALAAKIISSNL